MKTNYQLSLLALAIVMASFTPLQRVSDNTRLVAVIKNSPSIQWKSVEMDLGEIKHNQPKTIEFEFVNTGTVPVLITGVQASCGCTATDYSKDPIAPGQSAKIKATYNAATVGSFKKTITVNTNAEEQPRTLYFKGTVI